jgi:hypothetical protein
MAGLSEELRAGAADVWEAQHRHPFVSGIRGTARSRSGAPGRKTRPARIWGGDPDGDRELPQVPEPAPRGAARHRGAALRGLLPAGEGEGRPRARRGGSDGRPDPLPQDEAGGRRAPGRQSARAGRAGGPRRAPGPSAPQRTARRAGARPQPEPGLAASARSCWTRRGGCTDSACRCGRWPRRCSTRPATRARTAPRWRCASSSSAAAGRSVRVPRPGARGASARRRPGRATMSPAGSGRLVAPPKRDPGAGRPAPRGDCALQVPGPFVP